MAELTKQFKHPIFPGLEYKAVLADRGLEKGSQTDLIVEVTNNNVGFNITPNEIEVQKIAGPATVLVFGGTNSADPLNQGETRVGSWLVKNTATSGGNPSYTLRVFVRPFATVPAFFASFDMPVTPS